MLAEKGIQPLYDRVSSTGKEWLTLHASGHVVTVDSEWQVVGEKSCQFIMERVPQAA